MNKNGFTLIELIIGIVLYSIIIGVAGLVFIVVLREWSSTQIRSNLRQDAVIAVERLTRELNEAREITSALDNSILFWWQDTDADEVRDSSEVVTFSWDGTAGTPLKRDDVTLAFDVENFQINYRDLNNSPLSPAPDLSLEDRDSIRRLDVQLKLSREDEEFTLLTSIIPRNLRQVRGPW
ncbi:MAG: prepilin-type N-terminal cleavage/methylation domain-containing protein [Candidatus Omnitrophota bacterium]|nr:MAG: prepilin-type N-terminal cleavage/methylation domain-containing protein [Candidatus Omnitrophota bacterium]